MSWQWILHGLCCISLQCSEVLVHWDCLGKERLIHKVTFVWREKFAAKITSPNSQHTAKCMCTRPWIDRYNTQLYPSHHQCILWHRKIHLSFLFSLFHSMLYSIPTMVLHKPLAPISSERSYKLTPLTPPLACTAHHFFLCSQSIPKHIWSNEWRVSYLRKVISIP